MKEFIIFTLTLFVVKVYPQIKISSPDGGDYAYKKINMAVLDTSDICVYYKLQFRPDSTKKEYRTGITALLISDKYTKFCDYYQWEEDSIVNFMAENNKNAHDERANLLFDDISTKNIYRWTVVNDLTTSTTTVQTFSLNYYEYTYPTPAIKWTLVNCDTIINSMPCKKAICFYAGRNYIAWYTTKISLPYGPFVFNGLPGLIIQIYDTKKNWIFTNRDIEKNSIPIYLYKGKKYYCCPIKVANIKNVWFAH